VISSDAGGSEVADMLELYGRASRWTNEKVAGATDRLDAATPCDGWDVRTLLNHMLDTARFFVSSATGGDAPLPAPAPPDLIGDDPIASFDAARDDMLRTYGEPGTIDRTGPSLAIAFSDQLLHGWDLARATGQDSTMPDGLAEEAYEAIHGRFTDDQRRGIFKPAVPIGDAASAQDRLLAYTGRDPGS
jgi:uncharacterized protein (TIGR03086 family)